MKRSDLKEMIREEVQKVMEFGWEYDIEAYRPKLNKEKETITFVNDAETKKALAALAKEKIKATRVGKTIKFLNTHDFKKAQTVIIV